MAQLGRLMILAGALLAAAGVLMMYYDKLPFPGKLPGDLLVKKGSFTFYFPLATSILVSVLITAVFWIFRSK